MVIVVTEFMLIIIFTLGHEFCAHKMHPNSDDSHLVGNQFEAVEGQFPYLVSIRNLSLSHRCGGSIISTKWILTASHCVINYWPTSLWVIVGSVDLDEGGDYHQVSKIICHEKYVSKSYSNDIAVLKLANALVFGPKVQSIQLDSRNLNASNCIILSGWGSSRKLRFAELKVIENSVCQLCYGKIPITNSQICTISECKVVHGGDSGSPLVFEGKQIGIVSWGYPYEDLPDVHTEVSAFFSWIESVTGECFTTNISVSQSSDVVQSCSLNQFNQIHRNTVILFLLLTFIF